MHTLAPEPGLLATRLPSPLSEGSSCGWYKRLSPKLSAEQKPSLLNPAECWARDMH